MAALSPTPGTDSHSAATSLLENLAIWENNTQPEPSTLESWQEPTDSHPGDFHLLDQPRSFQHREFHARPIRHHRP